MNKKFKKTLSVLLAVILIGSCFTMFGSAATVKLTEDDYGPYSGDVDGISFPVVGEMRIRYGTNVLDRYAMSVVGHKSTTKTTKCVVVGAYEVSNSKTRYIEIDTLKSSDGSRISALSQTNSTTGWKSKDKNNASWYATKTGISGSITSYVRYQCVYSSSTTYVGQPTLYNVA